MDLLAAKTFVLEKLKNELDNNLFYHCYNHTLDVYKSTLHLAALENIKGRDLIILETAALYHDAGFLTNYNDHEEGSIVFTKKNLPRFGYSDEEIDIIVQLIRSTKLPQNPQTILEKVLCDADLDYLGRDDFFMTASKLHCEWIIKGSSISLKEWFQLQVEFLNKNNYFTDTAKALRSSKKNENLSMIKELFNNN